MPISSGADKRLAKAGKPDDPSIKGASEVATMLGADPDKGLTSQEASRRLLENGPNELRAAARVPAWCRALAQFQDPLVYLLLAAIAIAFLAWWIEGRLGWPVDAIVIAIVVLLNGALGFAQQAKAVVHLGFLNLAFGTVPLTPEQWLVCAAMASVVLWLSELRKWVCRSWSHRHAAKIAGASNEHDRLTA
ncbi:MAG: cation-translocating P-type ATPase [Betaproteobacteria bacterium]